MHSVKSLQQASSMLKSLCVKSVKIVVYKSELWYEDTTYILYRIFFFCFLGIINVQRKRKY
jgi:hypothetical protein